MPFTSQGFRASPWSARPPPDRRRCRRCTAGAPISCCSTWGCRTCTGWTCAGRCAPAGPRSSTAGSSHRDPTAEDCSNWQHVDAIPFPTDPATERAEVFLRYLDYFRETVMAKTVALPDDELRRSRLPSGWTPLELLK